MVNLFKSLLKKKEKCKIDHPSFTRIGNKRIFIDLDNIIQLNKLLDHMVENANFDAYRTFISVREVGIDTFFLINKEPIENYLEEIEKVVTHRKYIRFYLKLLSERDMLYKQTSIILNWLDNFLELLEWCEK